MSKRQTAIAQAKVAGYHNDTRWFTRLIVESRVARPIMNEAWRHGALAKEAGVRCECPECKRAASAAGGGA